MAPKTSNRFEAETSKARTVKRSPRERLLDAATELFYAEGIQSVGIDRVIERAGVAKASLYSTFGSKEQLVCAYLDERRAQTVNRIRAATDAVDDPVQKILAVFEAQARLFEQRDFRGCAFNAAAAEAPPGSRIEQATRSYRQDMRALLTDLARQAGARDPELLASQLQLIYDGGGIAARSSRGADVAPARAAVETLIRVATQ
ncbi:MAG TPA: TetR/AcrR family transcriptional regulator [Solirubrobacteraceae bacterium]|nr:TetR/AcrR family transcriptional regulator [Solirubrobacteraceae bacterium]